MIGDDGTVRWLGGAGSRFLSFLVVLSKNPSTRRTQSGRVSCRSIDGLVSCSTSKCRGLGRGYVAAGCSHSKSGARTDWLPSRTEVWCGPEACAVFWQPQGPTIFSSFCHLVGRLNSIRKCSKPWGVKDSLPAECFRLLVGVAESSALSYCAPLRGGVCVTSNFFYHFSLSGFGCGPC